MAADDFKVLLSFSLQAFLSLVIAAFVFFLSKLGRLSVTHKENDPEYAAEIGRLKIVSRVVM